MSDTIVPKNWIDFCNASDEAILRLQRQMSGGKQASDGSDCDSDDFLASLNHKKTLVKEADGLQLAGRLAAAKQEFASGAIFTPFAFATKSSTSVGGGWRISVTQPEAAAKAAAGDRAVVVVLLSSPQQLEQFFGPCIRVKLEENVCYAVCPPGKHANSRNTTDSETGNNPKVFLVAICSRVQAAGRAMYGFATALADAVVDCTPLVSSCESEVVARAATVFSCVSAKLPLTTIGRPYLLFSETLAGADRLAGQLAWLGGDHGLASLRARFVGGYLGAVAHSPELPDGDAVRSRLDAGSRILHLVEQLHGACTPLRRSCDLPSRGTATRLPLSEEEWLEYVVLVAGSVRSFDDDVLDVGAANFCVEVFSAYEETRRSAIVAVQRQLAVEHANVTQKSPCDASGKALAAAFHTAFNSSDSILEALPGGRATDVSWASSDFQALCPSESFRSVLSMCLWKNMSGGFVGKKAMGTAPQKHPHGGREDVDYRHEIVIESSSALPPVVSAWPTLRPDDLSNHHIIPKDDLAFLWDYFHVIDALPFGLRRGPAGESTQEDERRRQFALLTQAEGAFKALLLPYAPPLPAQRTYFVWAAWNLFQGPSCALRSDDPSFAFRRRGAGGPARPPPPAALMADAERTRPRHLPEAQWALVQQLYQAVGALQQRARLARLLDESGRTALFADEQRVVAAMQSMATWWHARHKANAARVLKCVVADWIYEEDPTGTGAPGKWRVASS